jgi:hypothetical protein
MRSPLLLSAAVLAMGLAAATTGAHAQATSKTDSSNFNTSGPGTTNSTNPTGPSGKVGLPRRPHRPLRGTTHPSAGASAHSLDSQSLNTAEPGVSTSTGPDTARSITRPVNTPQAARAAVKPGDTSTVTTGTTGSQSAPGFNTGGPGETNGATPRAGTVH